DKERRRITERASPYFHDQRGSVPRLTATEAFPIALAGLQGKRGVMVVVSSEGTGPPEPAAGSFSPAAGGGTKQVRHDGRQVDGVAHGFPVEPARSGRRPGTR